VQRLAWLMAAQSFFFTGYAIIANGTTHTPATNCWPRNRISCSTLFRRLRVSPMF